jgi:hypothetical protein
VRPTNARTSGRAERAGGPGRSIRLAGSLLGERRHICAFFNSRDDEYRVTLPFIKDGIDCGDKAFHIVGSARRQDHLRRLAAAGIDTLTARETGQFELLDWGETYLAGGCFDSDRWLALVEEMFATRPCDGLPLSRVVAHMEWALEARLGVEQLLEYEARVNRTWPRNGNIAICTYDLARFGPDVIVDIIRTHPLIIIGGLLQENPFYVEPDEFLEELRERGAASRVAV